MNLYASKTRVDVTSDGTRYELRLPILDSLDGDGPELRVVARAFTDLTASGGAFLAVDIGQYPAIVQLFISPTAAHALAETLHALANVAAGLPADADAPGSADGPLTEDRD